MLFFLFVIPFLYVNGAYNDSFSRYKTWPMASAAYSDAPQLCVKDNFDNSSFIRQIDVPCDILLEICSGFTAISYSDNAIILSFRGASTPHIDVADELWDKMTKFPGGGHVGAYFYNGFMDIWNKGMKDDFMILKNAFPTAELWVTGHSLGAAMASVCAGYISALQYFSPDKIKLVTYGQPRVGDLAYATYIDQTIPYAYRVVHAFDMVPHVPLYGDNIGAIQNYTHHKSEVWYENDMVLGKPYVECDQNEGKNCSDQLEKLGLLDTNVLDHLWYFNVLADYAYFGCKRN